MKSRLFLPSWIQSSFYSILFCALSLKKKKDRSRQKSCSQMSMWKGKELSKCHKLLLPVQHVCSDILPCPSSICKRTSPSNAHQGHGANSERAVIPGVCVAVRTCHLESIWAPFRASIHSPLRILSSPPGALYEVTVASYFKWPLHRYTSFSTFPTDARQREQPTTPKGTITL
jgi:hypothetical protein